MKQLKGAMCSPRWAVLLLAAFSYLAICNAGPLGPLPNVTSVDLGLKEGSCAVGDVVYMAGDEFPGSGPCERCACAGGDVQCTRTRCELRPGCKALHRPDQCCPTYQCECEQEGRVYGNGEKLVDPVDPCRVCYCQGGEVVCRRIACFLRDDCKPRLVPGRCCPEYDNCPLRGVTTAPGVTPTLSSQEDMRASAAPAVPKEHIKQEITIKEITPVSEIPIITDVKIKEILPSPSVEVEYSSSKSPLIPREVTSEKLAPNQVELTERPVIIEIHPSSAPVYIASSIPEIIASSSEISESKITNDLSPSKFSLSTQDSINSDIYGSNKPVLGVAGSPSVKEIIPVATTNKPAIILEEDDPNLFDHNPAFPPIPDDLSVLTNHGEDIVPDTNTDDHGSHTPEIVTSTTTESQIVSEAEITTLKSTSDVPTSTSNTPESPTSTESITTRTEDTNPESSSAKQSPMLNLRSAIPTEILNIPSSVREDITGELDDVTEFTTASAEPSPVATTTESVPIKEEAISDLSTTTTLTPSSKPSRIPYLPGLKILEVTSPKTVAVTNAKETNEQSTTSVARSNVATEITAQTEFSSIPIETSDQNPHDVTGKDKIVTSSVQPALVEATPTKLSPIEPEVITISKDVPTITENQSFENVETTEFVLTSFGSSESATDTVELIKISPDSGKSAPIIKPASPKKNNVLTDLINLVGDVASISDHTDEPVVRRSTNSPTISDSEELIPVNAGYKSKNSNWNVNSITEIVPKSKNPVPVNKQKVIEIEDDDDGITDSPPPNDKVEPTTRRPIIDNVSDDMPENKTDKRDIEIINKTYVPNLGRRPTKVVMQTNFEIPIVDENGQLSASSEAVTDDKVSVSSEDTTPIVINASAEAEQRINVGEAATTTPSPTPQ